MKFGTALIGLILCIVIAPILHGASDPQHSIFALQFNIYALYSLAAVVTTGGLYIYMARRESRTRETLWLQAMLSVICVGALAEMFQRMSITSNNALFWWEFKLVVSMSIPLIILMFGLNYTRPQSSRAVIASLLFVATGIMAFFCTTPLFYLNTVDAAQQMPWGYIFPTGPLLWVNSLWIFLPVVWSLISLWYFGKKTPNKILKAQARIFFWAFTVPLVSYLFTGALFPALKIPLPTFTFQAFTVTVTILVIGISRFKVSQLSPSVFAQDILSTMDESVIVTTPELNVEYLNPSAALFFNTTADAIIAKPVETIFGSTNMTKITQKLTIPQKDALELDLVVSTKQIPVSLRTTDILTDGKTVAGHILVFRDITKERAAREVIEREVVARTKEVHTEQAKLQASIESLSVGFLLIDAKGTILMQNSAIKHIFKKDMPVTSLQELTAALTNFNLAEQAKTVQTTNKMIEAKAVPCDAKILHILLSPVQLVESTHAEILGTVVLIEDVTEQAVLERSKDEFFSIASHELRTPLTAIRGNASMIREYYQDALKDNDLKDMIASIETASVRLIAIVNDFLDISSLEQGKVNLSLEEFSLEEVIQSVSLEMKKIIDEKKLVLNNTIVSGSLPKVWADKNRTKQIIYNLIGNAVKFTATGGITLSAQVQNDMVKILVTDSGRGISLDNQKLLFHKFQQAGASLLTRDTTKGTGLGLYIVKLLTAAMGGTVAMEHTEENKGTTFTFSLPIATASRKASMSAKVLMKDTSTGLTKS